MRAAALSIAVLASLWAPLSFAQKPAAVHSPAPAPAATPVQGFEAFRMVRTKNIFDPDRLPFVTASAPRASNAAPPPKASDYVALTGIMVNGPKALAFFSGSRPDYDKVLPVNGEIAGAKVTKITPSNIEVDRGGKKISVAVGQTVPFDSSAPAAAPEAAPSFGGSDSSSAPPPSSPGNMSDVMRRMMERRQKDLK